MGFNGIFYDDYDGPKVHFEEELIKQGLTTEEIKNVIRKMDEKIEKRNKHWFWKIFKF